MGSLYPNHPLFRIAPLLYNWRGDPRHDEYTSRLVGRIRAGRYTPELFDCNSIYLTYPERAPIAADPPRLSVKSRYTMTADERKAWNNSYGDPAADAERARRKAKRVAAAQERKRLERERAAREAQRKAEEKRRDREWEEAREARKAEQERRDREWEEAQERLEEDRAILTAEWQCQTCLTKAEVQRWGDRYVLGCRNCGRQTWGERATLLEMMKAA